MKKVILYVRVSTDEQADKGFSLRDQEEKLKNYCKLYNYEVVNIYREDYSAKTFNRPEFKKLMLFTKQHSNDIDEVLFIKWDRFSRNTTESYNLIKTFNDLGITVNAIEQPLDLTIPEQGIMLAVYLSMPEVENQRRSLNVISGMRRAFKEGRYVASPPKGYYMGRDGEGKPILTPNSDSQYIKEAFDLLSSGVYNQREVREKLQKNGFNTSKSAFSRIIRNPLYCGDVYLKAFKEEKEVVVSGIHQALVSKELFNKVQQIIDGGKKQLKVAHKKINPKFPLKDFVRCPKCQKPLLASSSKGRSKYYSYYHCVSPCNTRYKLEDIDVWFQKFLNEMKFEKKFQLLFIKMIKEKLKLQSKTPALGPSHYKKVSEQELRLQKLQDLYVDGKMDNIDYIATKKRYKDILDSLKEKEVTKQSTSGVFSTIEHGIVALSQIDVLFENLGIDGKRNLIGSIFPKKFEFEKNKVRTADVNPVLLKIMRFNKGSKGYKKRDTSYKKDISRLVLKAGLEPARPLLTTGF